MGPPDVCVLPFPPQTTGVDLVVKTVPVPDTGDSVVSGPLAPPRELSAAPALPVDSGGHCPPPWERSSAIPGEQRFPSSRLLGEGLQWRDMG